LSERTKVVELGELRAVGSSIPHPAKSPICACARCVAWRDGRDEERRIIVEHLRKGPLMSATGLSDVRRADDFYETPAWCTKAILAEVGAGSRHFVLDPCAGRGAILDVIWNTRRFDKVGGIELRLAHAEHTPIRGYEIEVRDALDPERSWGKPDLIVMNPPFKLAMQFVQRALVEILPRGLGRPGDVAALLRLNWLGSQGRAAFHRRYPADIFVMPRRPSFTGDGATDSIDYAWFVWGEGRGNRWAVLDVEGSER
jgi:hypothetical protein